MSTYRPTIGLEIHAELKTRTKMFCSSKNDPDEERPNVNVCPVCMAHPGTLPVINREAVRHVLRVGVALGAQLADYTEFDRKNYFYPDLPKGYQISQYEFPLVAGGSLAGVQITRVHLEEDTASSMHIDADERGLNPQISADGNQRESGTLVDFNRAGVPLMELVTEPVVHSAEEAGKFARELQLLLRYLGASDANMEKGQMRVEANISVSKDGTLGTKVEVKNLNSFKAMERAVAHEIIRQSALLDRGEKVIQETRGWDEGKQSTFAQRIKEGSADYRYFPDPDLPSLKLSEFPGCTVEEISKTLAELPGARRSRYASMGLKRDDVELFLRDARLGAFFELVVSGYKNDIRKVTLAANYIANDLVNLMRDMEGRDTEIQLQIPISVEHFNTIINLLASGKVSSRGGKDLLLAVVQTGKEPGDIAQENGLFQTSSAHDLAPVVEKILSDNAGVVSEYKAGKSAALEYLVGQGMKISRGTGDPAALRTLILERIS